MNDFLPLLALGGAPPNPAPGGPRAETCAGESPPFCQALEEAQREPPPKEQSETPCPTDAATLALLSDANAAAQPLPALCPPTPPTAEEVKAIAAEELAAALAISIEAAAPQDSSLAPLLATGQPLAGTGFDLAALPLATGVSAGQASELIAASQQSAVLQTLAPTPAPAYPAPASLAATPTPAAVPAPGRETAEFAVAEKPAFQPAAAPQAEVETAPAPGYRPQAARAEPSAQFEPQANRAGPQVYSEPQAARAETPANPAEARASAAEPRPSEPLTSSVSLTSTVSQASSKPQTNSVPLTSSVSQTSGGQAQPAEAHSAAVLKADAAIQTPAANPLAASKAQAADPLPAAQSTPVSAAAKAAVTEELNGQLTQHIASLARLGKGEYRIRLYPEHLGKIDLRLTPSPEGLTVSIQAELKATGALLEERLHELSRALHDAGVSLSGLSVNHGREQRHAAYGDPQRQPAFTKRPVFAESGETAANEQTARQWASASAIDYRI